MQPRKHESEAPTVLASRVGDAFRSSSGRFGEPRVSSASAAPPLDTLHKRRILPFSTYIRSRHIRCVRRVSSDVYLDSALLSFFLYPISTLSPFSFLLSPTTVTPFCRSSRERQPRVHAHLFTRIRACTRRVPPYTLLRQSPLTTRAMTSRWAPWRG